MGDDAHGTEVRFTLNGAEASADVRPDEIMLETLREALDIRSVRGSCGIGGRGAFPRRVDGHRARPRLLPRRPTGRRTGGGEEVLHRVAPRRHLARQPRPVVITR